MKVTTHETMSRLIATDQLDLLETHTLEELTQLLQETVDNELADYHYTNLSNERNCHP